jgi:hypothetical protein
MSSVGSLGAAPLKLIVPVTLPAVFESTLMVAGSAGAAAGCGSGCELLQPAKKETTRRTVAKQAQDQGLTANSRESRRMSKCKRELTRNSGQFADFRI